MHKSTRRRAEFQSRGFVSLPDFLSAEQLATLNDHVDRMITEVVPDLPREQVYYEDRTNHRTLKQIQRLADLDPFFDELMHGEFEALARELLGEPVVAKNLQFFNKPPGCNRPTPPHQDGYYFMLDPCHALTMWLALEDVSEQQGCVHYVEGSHRNGVRPHGDSNVLGFSQHLLDFGTAQDLENDVALPCRAGHLLAHDALLVHHAGANTTANRSRRALGFIYYGASAREDTRAQARYQEQLAERLAGEGQI